MTKNNNNFKFKLGEIVQCVDNNLAYTTYNTFFAHCYRHGAWDSEILGHGPTRVVRYLYDYGRDIKYKTPYQIVGLCRHSDDMEGGARLYILYNKRQITPNVYIIGERGLQYWS